MEGQLIYEARPGAEKKVMEIEISKDKLEASLHISRDDFQMENWVQKLEEAIALNKIPAKISTHHIQNEFKDPDVNNKTIVLCKGKAAVKGSPSTIKIKGKALTDLKRYEELKRLFKDGSPHWVEISKKYPDVKLVEEGEKIGELQMGRPSISGEDIWGNPIEAIAPKEKAAAINKNSVEVRESGDIIALKAGIVCHLETILEVFVVQTNFNFELEVSNDKMLANLNIFSSANNTWPNREEIENFIKKSKITFGIQNENISKFIKQAAEIKEKHFQIELAKGNTAVDGKNGYIKMLINLTPNLKPKKNEDGSVSFKDVNVIKIVEKNQELAKIIPPQKGTPGKDVYGTPIAAQNGKAIPPPLGNHVSIHPQKTDVIISDLEGIAKIESGKIHVNEGCIIKGNVDFHTGNIYYAKDIIVQGDVMPEFRIDCGGNLEIEGAVESAFIKTAGKVSIKSGFIGHEKSWIRAGDDVEIKYVRDQQIFTNGSIHISGEAIQARLFSGKAIHCYSKKNSFTGGGAAAYEFMEAQEIGNPSEQKTYIVLGWHPKALIVSRHINAKLQKAGELKNQKRVDQLQNLLFKIEKKYPINKNAYLRVHQKIYPGLILQIGHDKRVIQDEISHCLVKLDGGGIGVFQ